MIALKEKEKKYDKAAYKIRLERIWDNRDTVLQIIDQELPDAKTLKALLDSIEAPKLLDTIGVSPKLFPIIFAATKDIRDKYVLSRLAWDLGILEKITKP